MSSPKENQVVPLDIAATVVLSPFLTIAFFVFSAQWPLGTAFYFAIVPVMLLHKRLSKSDIERSDLWTSGWSLIGITSVLYMANPYYWFWLDSDCIDRNTNYVEWEIARMNEMGVGDLSDRFAAVFLIGAFAFIWVSRHYALHLVRRFKKG